MKKLIAVIVAGVFALGLTGCGDSGTVEAPRGTKVPQESEERSSFTITQDLGKGFKIVTMRVDGKPIQCILREFIYEGYSWGYALSGLSCDWVQYHKDPR